MMVNEEHEADAYDITCRVPDCGFEHRNVCPTLAATFMLEHAQNGSHRPLGEPMFSMRVVEGFLGTDPDNPLLTPDDGWRRSPTLNNSD